MMQGKNDDNESNELKKDSMRKRSEDEQKAKASNSRRRSSKRSGQSGSSRSPRRRASSEDLDGNDATKPRSSRSSKHSSSGTSPRRSKSRDTVDSFLGGEDAERSSKREARKSRLKNRTDEEQAAKAAARRTHSFDARARVVDSMDDLWEEDVRDNRTEAGTLSSLDLNDADLKKKKRSSRSRSRSTESMGSVKKPRSRRRSSDDKSDLKISRSRREEIKPGVEVVRHRSSRRSHRDILSKSHRSTGSNSSGPTRDNNIEVNLQAISVEDDTQDQARIQMIERRNDDLEQRLEEVIQDNKKDKRVTNTETSSTKNGASRLTVLLVLFLGIGIGLGIGYILRLGCKVCVAVPCETDAPTVPPTAEVTPAPTTSAPTIDFAYVPPSEEDCAAIRNMAPINGQSELAVKTIDILVDTSLTNGSLEDTNWPKVLAQAMAAYLVPDLVGCPGPSDPLVEVAHQSPFANAGSDRRNLRSIRYVIANAIAIGERRYQYACEDGVPEPCYKAAVVLTLLLKGEEPNVNLFTLISDVILAYGGEPLVDRLGLTKNTFSFVNIVGMEEVPYEPSSEAACNAIADQLPVPSQDTMIEKFFDIAFDVTLANSGISDWLPLLVQALAELLVPELACCGDGEPENNGRMLQELETGRNIRCAVGNAIPSATQAPDLPCQSGSGADCFRSVLNLQTFLKGDESDLDVAALITNVIRGNVNSPIVDRYGLPRDTFSSINIIIVESRDTISPTTLMPSDSPSVNPTVAPVVGPTTKDPTRAPTLRPTSTPTIAPTRNPSEAPTRQPVVGPSPPPTVFPTLAPTLSPTPGPSSLPSPEPSLRPSSNPSPEPSTWPSQVPTNTQQPSRVPTAAPTTRRSALETILAPYVSGTNPSFDWLADEDTWFPPAEAPNPDLLWTERYAAVKVKDAIPGMSGWKDGNSACTWNGIVCDAGGQISELSYAVQSLAGSIPSEIAILTALSILNLRQNALTGGIPTEIGSLTLLTELRLGGNRGMMGTIPTELGQLVNVGLFHLDGLDLVGTIPTELGLLASVRNFDLDGNDLTGTIPTEFENITPWNWFSLTWNNLHGPLPNMVGVSSGYCVLDGNCFTGSISGCSMGCNWNCP